jgi:predicted cupin superfamily sugar epimerase
MLSANAIITRYGLEPLPGEGGFFRRVYEHADSCPPEALPAGYTTPRRFCTAIDYLVTAESFSALHRIPGEERFVFLAGDPAEMLQLEPAPGTEARLVTLGDDTVPSHARHTVVRANLWQGLRLKDGPQPHGYAFFSVTVSPGYEDADFELAAREALLASHPGAAALIRRYTR